jgi:glycosyltransferase involved in cell wall biosynthesis
MKLLCIFPANYRFAFGGGAKASKELFVRMAAAGHEVHVVDTGTHPDRDFTDTIAALDPAKVAGPRVQVNATDDGGVQVYSANKGNEFARLALQQVNEFAPDWTLVQHDRSLNLTELLFEPARGRVVWLVHSTHTLPFGPDGYGTILPYERLEVVRRLAGIATVSQFQRDYVRWWAGASSEVLRYPAYGAGPFPDFGQRADGKVMMINNGAVKGQPIFVALAQRLPAVRFAVVPTWAGSRTDLEELKQLNNVEILDPEQLVDDVLIKAKILLMPSLWHEGFPLSAVEAMLRGIPVLASNAGGAAESMLGLEWAVLPVTEIREYARATADVKLVMPTPVVPPQSIEPWERALMALLNDAALYRERSAEVRERAHRFVESTSIADFDRFLSRLKVRHTSLH